MPKTTREALHSLVDQLPEFTWDEVNLILQEYATESESGEYYIWDAPVVEASPSEIAAIEEAYADLREASPSEIAAIEEAYADLREGRAELIPHEEVVKYFQELP